MKITGKKLVIGIKSNCESFVKKIKHYSVFMKSMIHTINALGKRVAISYSSVLIHKLRYEAIH